MSLHKRHARKTRLRVWLDRCGVLASAVCLLHCLATPIVIVLLPLAGADGFEGTLALVLLSLASLSGLLALARGDRRPAIPLVLGLVGLLARGSLVEGSLSEALATLITTLAFASTHILSLLPRRRPVADDLFQGPAWPRAGELPSSDP